MLASFAAAVVGELVSQNLDLSRASIGQSINPPYETTVGESQQCLWMSTFQVSDRLYTSTPFAQLLHLPQHVLPFYMVSDDTPSTPPFSLLIFFFFLLSFSLILRNLSFLALFN